MVARTEFLNDNACYCITNRGIKSQMIFNCDKDYKYYFKLLRKYKSKYKIRVFAFCLMSESIWLIIQPWKNSDISFFMKAINRAYSSYFKPRYKHEGRLWQSKHKVLTITKDEDLFDCIKFIEFLPVKAHISDSPVSYPWSSCCYRVLKSYNHILDNYAFLSNGAMCNVSKHL